MTFETQPPHPRDDYAQPELRALLDRGVEPLKTWIRTELTHAHPDLGFHATSEWDNNVLACYLSHFLPRLPPTFHWQQDVLVVHFPEHWQNESYNRIYTQCSGNCLIPDDFHAFLLDLTHAFGKRFIPVRELLFWLEHGKAPDQAAWEAEFVQDQRLLASLASVEARTGGAIERATIQVLTHFGRLEWVGVLTVIRHGDPVCRALHVSGEQITVLNSFQAGELGRWFDEMRERAYFPRSHRRGFAKTEESSPTLSLVTPEGSTVVLTGPLSEFQVVNMAEGIAEARENRAISTFLEEIWGDVETIESVRFDSIETRGEEAISSCQVFDQEGAARLPQLDLPFWQERLGETPSLKEDLDACESDEARRDVLNEFLFRGGFFKAYELPDPKGEHPVFQRKVSLRSLPLTYPRLYTAH